MTLDPLKIGEIISEIADEEIVPRFGRLSPDEIRHKSTPNDLVTEVDEAVEASLKKALSGVCPETNFIGEELAAQNPDIVKALDGQGRFWIVDPLDGTRNFVNGVEEFATIVALVENGVTLMGWIYAVPEAKIAIGERGNGALWAQEPVRVKKQSADKETGVHSLGWLTPNWKPRIVKNLKTHFSSSAMHCSAYAYLRVLRGEKDFKLSSRIHPWDHVAGALMVTEAGGRVAFVDDGTEYAPSSSVDRPLLAAASGRDWDAMAAKLRTPV